MTLTTETNNPYAAPQSEVMRDAERPEGVVLPFEDPAWTSFGRRISDTLKWLYLDWEKASQGLRRNLGLGAPIGFYGLMALVPAILIGLLAIIDPIQPFWRVWMGAPRPVQPSGAALIVALVTVVLGAPASAAIGVAVIGLCNHAGLWLVKGTREGLGLLVTFRAVLYTSAAVTFLTLPFSLLGHLPGRVGSYMLVPSLLISLAASFYKGTLLAKAHRTQVWRGILGVWLPILVFGGLAAVCVASIWFLGGEAFQRAFLHSLRGGR
jgi:hypothetical protein